MSKCLIKCSDLVEVILEIIINVTMESVTKKANFCLESLGEYSTEETGSYVRPKMTGVIVRIDGL
jgi:hypothetical protein